MNNAIFLRAKDGIQIFLNRQRKDSDFAVVVMAHGLGEYSGSFRYMERLLNQAGISTYTPDHRGHGRSGGEKAFLNNYRDLLDDFDLTVQLAIKENPGKPIFLYGHSMGGFTVSLYAVDFVPQISGIITSGALVRDCAGIFRNFPRKLDIHKKVENTFTWQICSVEERVTEFRNDKYATLFNTAGIVYQLVEGLNWFQDKIREFDFPVFMTHGADDCIVSPEDTFEFFHKANSVDKQMKVYGGAHHALFNEFCRDEVISDYVSWIMRRSKRLEKV